MADEIFLGGEKPKAIHPIGQFAAKCVDAIDLGENPEAFDKSKPAKLKRKGVVVWLTGEVNPDTGHPFEVSVEYTLSLFEGSNIRTALESWRGKTYSDEEIEKGDIPLHKLVGQWCMLTMAHKPTQKGRTRAAPISVVKLHDAIPKPTLAEYTRAEFWDKKKAEYAEAAAKFRKENLPSSMADMPEALAEDDSDFPF